MLNAHITYIVGQKPLVLHLAGEFKLPRTQNFFARGG